MSVYFIGGVKTGLVKIGHSTDAKFRLMGMQVGSPDDLVLLMTLPGGKAEEEELHRRFGYCRVRGEWFAPDNRLWWFIERQGGSVPPGFGAVSHRDDRLTRVATEARAVESCDATGLIHLARKLGDVASAVDDLDHGRTFTHRLIEQLEELASITVAWANELDDDLRWQEEQEPSGDAPMLGPPPPKRAPGRKGPKPSAVCGTNGAYDRHVRYGEPPCDACREARNEYARDYRARKRAEKQASA